MKAKRSTSQTVANFTKYVHVYCRVGFFEVRVVHREHYEFYKRACVTVLKRAARGIKVDNKTCSHFLLTSQEQESETSSFKTFYIVRVGQVVETLTKS